MISVSVGRLHTMHERSFMRHRLITLVCPRGMCIKGRRTSQKSKSATETTKAN